MHKKGVSQFPYLLPFFLGINTAPMQKGYNPNS